MKIFNLKIVIPAILLTAVVSCEDELPTRADFSSVKFTDVDANGGTWKPVLLTAPTQIVVTAPDDVSSSAYVSEVAAVKSATADLTVEQKDAVKFWTNNPAIRWNEIALELVAKYNLIPGPNDDGTYTLPNSANPQGPPPFPFAHPPYACRAFSYLSVAQYDGLISAWHYKYAYNRPAPYKVDSTIPFAYEKNDLPSYPSDGAVIATASRDILSALFPLEKEYLAAKAEEHLQSLIWSGGNTESDVTAGKYIGVEVAKVALARAATDGMKKAQTPKPVSDSIKAAAFARFGWQWDNQEIPQRPVGLTPLFGKVKPWSVPDITTIRPPVPPTPGSAEFQVAADELINYINHMTEGKRKIANWWADGLNTYTPPGHWNKFAKEYIIKYSLSPIRTARTFAYMNMAIMDAGISCWDAKYYYHYPRPIQTIPGFKTILGTPNFPSYTSGHSTFSAAAAEVLSYIFPSDAATFDAWAREAAESRIYAGIHYRFDAEAGITQGKAAAQFTITRAKADGADN